MDHQNDQDPNMQNLNNEQENGQPQELEVIRSPRDFQIFCTGRNKHIALIVAQQFYDLTHRKNNQLQVAEQFPEPYREAMMRIEIDPVHQQNLRDIHDAQRAAGQQVQPWNAYDYWGDEEQYDADISDFSGDSDVPDQPDGDHSNGSDQPDTED